MIQSQGKVWSLFPSFLFHCSLSLPCTHHLFFFSPSILNVSCFYQKISLILYMQIKCSLFHFDSWKIILVDIWLSIEGRVFSEIEKSCGAVMGRVDTDVYEAVAHSPLSPALHSVMWWGQLAVVQIEISHLGNLKYCWSVLLTPAAEGQVFKFFPIASLAGVFWLLRLWWNHLLSVYPTLEVLWQPSCLPVPSYFEGHPLSLSLSLWHMAFCVMFGSSFLMCKAFQRPFWIFAFLPTLFINCHISMYLVHKHYSYKSIHFQKFFT